MKTFITITIGCLFAVGYPANAQLNNTGHIAQDDKKPVKRRNDANRRYAKRYADDERDDDEASR